MARRLNTTPCQPLSQEVHYSVPQSQRNTVKVSVTAGGGTQSQHDTMPVFVTGGIVPQSQHDTVPVSGTGRSVTVVSANSQELNIKNVYESQARAPQSYPSSLLFIHDF